MKAYLIISHKSETAVRDLFRYIFLPENIYFIHVDKKAPDKLQRLAGQLASSFENVHLSDRNLCSWGGFSLVELTRSAIYKALNETLRWSHFIILSESHLPLFSASFINEKLDPNLSYLEMYHPGLLNASGLEDIWNRFRYIYRELPGVGSFATGFRSNIPAMEIHLGSQWMVLHRELCEIIVRTTNEEDWNFFSTSLMADETAFQTFAAMANVPDGRISKQNQTFIAVSQEITGPSMIFGEDQFFSARDQGRFLFIRKRPEILPKSIWTELEKNAAFSAPVLNEILSSRHVAKERDENRIAPEELLAHLKWHLVPFDNELQLISMRDVENMPHCCIELSYPYQSDRLALRLISENMVDFKVVMNICSELITSFHDVSFFGHRTEVIRARVHGLAYQREVYLSEDAEYGFLTVRNLSDLTCLVVRLRLYLEKLKLFSYYISRGLS